ncbi:MAG: roadblock/LC7 domain-containing protein [Gemmatimonadetes bacterium]|nr:roadblock/LC7 domain-containing protein [Gemmatimonadota bacterium]
MLGALSWSFQEADSDRVDSLLEALLADSGADRALLIDRTGQLIAAADAAATTDATAFASLAAADFAANEQLAGLVGARDFSSLYHQGSRQSLYLAGVAGRAILALVFGRAVTLGMVRIKVRRALPPLEALFQEVFTRPQDRGDDRLTAGWANEVEVEIDRLFDGV